MMPLPADGSRAHAVTLPMSFRSRERSDAMRQVEKRAIDKLKFLETFVGTLRCMGNALVLSASQIHHHQSARRLFSVHAQSKHGMRTRREVIEPCLGGCPRKRTD
jgi:hypothetical protein